VISCPGFTQLEKETRFLTTHEKNISGFLMGNLSANIIVPKKDIGPHLDYLGEGGFGKVHTAVVYGNLVAVKEFKNIGEGTKPIAASAILDFQKEVEIYTTLSHAHVLKFMGACFPNSEKDPQYYALITEHAENGSLYSCLYNSRGAKIPVKFSFTKKMKIIEEIAKGMHYLHTHNPPVYHFDLKSSNIMLDENFSVRIGDFGFAQFFLENRLIFKSQQVQGGTPVYSAPEVLVGKYNFNAPDSDKADVYSFSILVNEIITERIPFYGSNLMSLDDLKQKVTTGELQENRPTLGEHLKDLIKQCWVSDPSKRPNFVKIMSQEPWKIGTTDSSPILNDIKEQISRLFENGKTLKFGAFVKLFARILNESKNLHIEHETNGPFDKPMIRMVMAAIGLAKGSEEVKLDNIEHLFLWVDNKTKKEEFLDHIYTLMNSEWFFGLFKSQQEIQRFFSQAKSGNYCVHWDMNEKKFILSYIPSKKKDTDVADITVTVKVLPVQNINELFLWMKNETSSFKLKDPLATKPEMLRKLKMKEAFATSDSSNYSFNTEVKAQHFQFIN